MQIGQLNLYFYDMGHNILDSSFQAGFVIVGDIKPYSFEPLAKKVTESINCEELAAASAYNNQPQSTTRVGLECICLCWYNYKFNW